LFILLLKEKSSDVSPLLNCCGYSWEVATIPHLFRNLSDSSIDCSGSMPGSLTSRT
jgi:hypothetical protein